MWRAKAGSGAPADAGSVEVAVVHRPRYDDWSLPKGKLDPAETVPHCAAREVHEETGFEVILGRRLGIVEYPAPAPVGWNKRVDYFSAEAGRGEFAANHEVDEMRWLGVAEASELVTRPSDRDILSAFAALPPILHSVLLVRHAKAGNKSAWTDDDAFRPLSASGRRQAAALRSMLPLFGVDRIISAPRVRCTQTVEGVGEDLGIGIATEHVLSEDGYRQNGEAALSCLLEIAGKPGSSVVCSQGGVIPDLVRRLSAGDGLPIGDVTSKKGSVWALFFQQTAERPRLVAADYFPSALGAPPPPGKTGG
jgi:8-oxo-dGTP pyrophosphatase MutT (NUDIX family)/phosphohistidine phosphatase SixA